MTLPTLIETNAKVRELLNAHNQLDGYHEVVTDKSGQKIAVPKSYILPVRAIVDITNNIKLLREHVVAAGDHRDEVLKRVSDGTNEIDGEKDPQKLKDFVKAEADIWDTKVEIKGLRLLKLSDLLNADLDEIDETKKDKKRVPNAISQTVLASLSPVLDIFQPEKVEKVEKAE